jgi:hypothetical protein
VPSNTGIQLRDNAEAIMPENSNITFLSWRTSSGGRGRRRERRVPGRATEVRRRRARWAQGVAMGAAAANTGGPAWCADKRTVWCADDDWMPCKFWSRAVRGERGKVAQRARARGWRCVGKLGTAGPGVTGVNHRYLKYHKSKQHVRFVGG